MSRRLLVLAAALLAGCDNPVSTIQPLAGNDAAARAAAAPSLTASATAWDFIVLTWTNDSQLKNGWEVYKSTAGPSGTFVKLADVSPSTTRYEENQLLPQTEYCYKVRWFHISGKNTTYGSFSAVACVTTPEIPRPGAPALVRVMPVGSSAVQIDWQYSSADPPIRVERSTDAGATWTAVDTVQAPPHYYVDITVTAEVRVCHRLITLGELRESLPSSEGCTTAPADASNLTYEILDDTSYVVRWSDNSAVEDSYQIWVFGYRLNEYYGNCYDEIGVYMTLPANSTSVILNRSVGFGGIGARSGGGGNWVNQRIELQAPPEPQCGDN